MLIRRMVSYLPLVVFNVFPRFPGNSYVLCLMYYVLEPLFYSINFVLVYILHCFVLLIFNDFILDFPIQLRTLCCQFLPLYLGQTESMYFAHLMFYLFMNQYISEVSFFYKCSHMKFFCKKFLANYCCYMKIRRELDSNCKCI